MGMTGGEMGMTETGERSVPNQNCQGISWYKVAIRSAYYINS